jgi:hypothetical protein
VDRLFIAGRGLRSFFVKLAIEDPAGRVGIDELIARLERSGQVIITRAMDAKGTPENCDKLSHIIGIERWGQSRLRVALGEPFTQDEYDSYRPQDMSWSDLQALFHTTRIETISLVKSLRMAGIDPHTRVAHNAIGNLSLLGWLAYLNAHASMESRKIA